MNNLTLYDKVHIIFALTFRKPLLLDGLSNWIVSVTAVSLILGPIAGWSLEQYVAYWIFSPIAAFTIGAFYGRFLNKWRSIWRYK